MDPLQNLCRDTRSNTSPKFLRKFENLFYYIFIALVFTGFILPFVQKISKALSYTVGVLSLLYAIAIYFLRFGIKVTCGLVFHTSALLVCLSILLFGFELYVIGGAFLAVAVVAISIAISLHCFGHRMCEPPPEENAVAENGAMPEDNQSNVDGQLENGIPLDPLNFNDNVNPPEMPNDVNPDMPNNDDDLGVDLNDWNVFGYPKHVK